MHGMRTDVAGVRTQASTSSPYIATHDDDKAALEVALADLLDAALNPDPCLGGRRDRARPAHAVRDGRDRDRPAHVVRDARGRA